MSIQSKLLPAIGLAGLVAGGGAQAAGLVAAGNAFHISGSTALDNQVKDAILLGTNANGVVPLAQTTCQAGTISVYTDAQFLGAGVGNLTKSHEATVVCNLQNTIVGGPAAGTLVAFTKESNGGSNEGTYYEAAQQPLLFFDATQAPVGCSAVGGLAGGYYWTHQQAIAAEFDGCTGTNIQVIPEVGVADENPALFTIGAQATSAALIASLNTTPLFQNQFAIGVSLNLYRALQTQQGLVVNDDTLAQMPSLTRAQIAALFNGNILNWNEIVSPTGVALATQPVFTCRRGDNSGTNVSADEYFLHNRCAGNPTPMVQASTANNSTACNGLSAGQTPENNGCHWQASNIADATFAGAAGGDVASCLDAHARNGDFAYGPLGDTSKFDDPNGATGAATEAGTNHWRYIAIGGNKPTVEAMANGNYDYEFDNVLNLWTGLAGAPLAVGNYFKTLFQNPVALTDILVAQPNAKSFPGGVVDANYVTGGLQDGNPNAPAAPQTLAQVKASPISQFTYSSSGTVNDCQVPTIYNVAVTKEVY